MLIIRKALIACALLATSINAIAWSSDSGTVEKVWENGWAGKPDHFCFELTRSDNTTQLYGIRADATASNKARIFSLLLTAQTTKKPVEIHYHPTISLGPSCEIGNVILPSYGISNITIQP